MAGNIASALPGVRKLRVTVPDRSIIFIMESVLET